MTGRPSPNSCVPATGRSSCPARVRREAVLAVAAEFESVYISGYAVAGWQAGKPDIGLIGLRRSLDCGAQV